MKNSKKVDVLIIGAGPSGTVAAAYLKNNGFDVLVVEKQKFPRYVIGESLLPRTLDHLEEVGLLDEVKNAGFQEKLGATFFDKNGKKCEFLFAEQFTKAYGYAWQVPRDNFDVVLTDAAQKKGIEILFENTVENVEFKDCCQVSTISNSEGKYTVESKFVIDASGYGRVLPRQLNLNIPSTLKTRSSVYTQLKNNYKGITQKQDNIFIDTLDDKNSWMWIIPFNDGRTSVGLVGEDEWIKTFSENPKKMFKEFVQKNDIFNSIFSKIEFLFEPIVNRGYSIGVKQLFGNGYVLVGNSTEFLDPVFSSGIMLATETGVLAAKLAARQLKGEKVDWQKEYSDPVNFGVEVFRSYVDAWYDGTLHTIFFTNEIRKDIKEQICSVLAGYVFDMENPFVKKHKRALENLAKVVRMG